MQSRMKRIWTILLSIILMISIFSSAAFAASTLPLPVTRGGEGVTEGEPEKAVSCISILPDAPVTATINAGEQYSLDLNTVFSDIHDHSLAYSFETSVENEHTKIVGDTFYFSTQNPGSYDVTLTASCVISEASHILVITVEEGNAGLPEQYNYDETPQASVTVYVTLSNDGYPLRADDDTVISHLEVTVPYFDLALYGLEDYYRYGTSGGSGEYVDQDVIERPTGLHLYIYLLERYYMGLEEDQCCLGTSGVLDYAGAHNIHYMDWDLAYESDSKRALQIMGSATSLYMTNFWGHDENLMYYRNHCYPYMSPGWGATSDYILLSDGDTWDVAMFTNWNFYHSGYFACFDQDAYTVDPGESLTVRTQGWGTTSQATDFEPKTDLSVALYNSNWEFVEPIEYDAASTDGSLTFTAPETTGTYYLMALDPNFKDNVEAKIAPATARLIVSEVVDPEPTYGDLDGDGSVSTEDIVHILLHVNGTELAPEQFIVADVNNDGMVNMADVSLILQYINGAIVQFPAED